MSCKELTHWKGLWCWEGMGAGGQGDDRGWDGWMASLTWWTWVWVKSGSWVMYREAWLAMIHGVAKSWTQLSDWTELNWMAVSLKSLCNCWSETSRASQVKSKTGPHKWRARKIQTKRQLTIDWYAGGLIRKGTYIQALSWAAAWQIDHHPCLSESWEFIQRP